MYLFLFNFSTTENLSSIKLHYFLQPFKVKLKSDGKQAKVDSTPHRPIERASDICVRESECERVREGTCNVYLAAIAMHC